MKTALKVIMLLAVAGYLVVTLILIPRPTRQEICEGVDILIQDSASVGYISQTYVSDILASKKISPEGQREEQIDLNHIRKSILSNAYIDSVLCYFTASHHVCIKVFPRHPMIHVMTDAGDDYYVDDRGNTMPAGDFNLDLYLVTGNVNRTNAKELIPVVQYLEKSEFWHDQIEQIVYDDNRHIWLIPRTGEHRIMIGNTADLDNKMQRLQEFYSQGLDRVGWNRYETLDVSYEGQLVATRRK